tara:strand:- start:3686 stop:4036 length:351 start_codon:yes stop_codon:yes gene_type:complete
MQLLIIKYLSTAAIVVLVSEIVKRSDRLGAFIAALPLVTLLVLFWMYYESQSLEKISNHAWFTFWYVIPTLPMFALFPMLLPRLGFWFTILASIGITFLFFILTALIAKRLGIELV